MHYDPPHITETQLDENSKVLEYSQEYRNQWINFGENFMNREKIEGALTGKKEKKVLHPNGFTLASVLIPLLDRGDNLYILFTKRSKHVKNHEGEVSFPGGVVEKEEDPEEAAIREMKEEIGVSSDEVEIMGRSPSVRTWTSRYVILPHVGYIGTHPVIQVNKSEVQDTFEVPMEFLKKENRKFEDDEDFIEESYMFRDYKIWGATARVLYRFLNLVLS